MSWFQLDPNSIASRARAGGSTDVFPSLRSSLWRGMAGFTIVSIAGFAPWALFGRWFYRATGEVGLYLICAAVFIGLSGLLLHQLIIGPGSLNRFYKLFGIAFAAYATAWILSWMSLRGHTGSLAGLFSGTVVMGWILTRAFDARGSFIKVIASLFLLNALGYFAGNWVESLYRISTGGIVVARLLWGVSYGIGFGSGLGLAFYFCQARAREILVLQTKSS